jgi:hypothetical protein
MSGPSRRTARIINPLRRASSRGARPAPSARLLRVDRRHRSHRLRCLARPLCRCRDRSARGGDHADHLASLVIRAAGYHDYIDGRCEMRREHGSAGLRSSAPRATIRVGRDEHHGSDQRRSPACLRAGNKTPSSVHRAASTSTRSRGGCRQAKRSGKAGHNGC